MGTGYGSIYEFNLSNNTYSTEYEFSCEFGCQPMNGVVRNGSKLYGILAQGGPYNTGTLYSYDTLTQVMTPIHYFDGGGQGGQAIGQVLIHNNKFYGVTQTGGVFGGGTLWTMNIDGTAFQVLHNFIGSAVTIPYPQAYLIIDGNVIYGTTHIGGGQELGTIYKYDLNTNLYTELFAFNGANGSRPGGLVKSGNNLYGVCLTDGAFGGGNIFSFNLNSNTLTELHACGSLPNFQDGNSPVGITLSGSKLYGTTYAGGTFDSGVIFSYDIFTNQYTVLDNFEVFENGAWTWEAPIIHGDYLYGTTTIGGVNNRGTIYKYQIPNPGASLNFDGINDYVDVGNIPHNSYTKQAWIKPTTISNSRSVISSNNSFFGLVDGHLTATNAQTTSGVTVSDANAIPINVWTHVAVTYDASSNALTLFKNGIQVAQVTNADNYINEAYRVGSRICESFFTGNMDEVRVYDYALSQCQIQENMNCELSANQNGLVLYYKFNQGEADGSNLAVNTVIDFSGNNLNGALNNFTLNGSNGSNWVLNGGVESGFSCSSITTVNVEICNGDSYFAGGAQQTTAGIYNDIVQNSAGCDIAVQTILTIRQGNSTTIDVSQCGSYTWNGTTYTSTPSVPPTFTYTNIFGCDSVVTLNLVISSNSSSSQVVNSCGSYLWIDGNTYTSNNNSATYLVPGGNINGCDSIVTLNLTIVSSISSTDIVSACGSYQWIDGNTYTSNNNTATYLVPGGSVNGCDSIVTLNLTILNSSSSIDIVSACGSYQWIDGNTYTSNNNTATYLVPGVNINGCDSTVTLNLTILNPSNSTDIVDACEPIVWIDGNTYSANNNTATYLVPGGNAAGCDSTVTLNLTITTVNSGATLNENSITATQANADSYQWFDCETNTEIAGATSQTFTATENGSYYAEVTINECTIETECLDVTTIGFTTLTENLFSIYPNPANDYFTLTSTIVNGKLSISDMNGRKVLDQVTVGTSAKINTSTFTYGVYFVEFSDFNAATIQRIKLVINK